MPQHLAEPPPGVPLVLAWRQPGIVRTLEKCFALSDPF